MGDTRMEKNKNYTEVRRDVYKMQDFLSSNPKILESLKSNGIDIEGESVKMAEEIALKNPELSLEDRKTRADATILMKYREQVTNATPEDKRKELLSLFASLDSSSTNLGIPVSRKSFSEP